MQPQETDRRIERVALSFLFGLLLSCGRPAFGQLPTEIIEEPRTRRISPIPGDFSFDVTRHTVPLDEIRGGGPPQGRNTCVSRPGLRLPRECQ